MAKKAITVPRRDGLIGEWLLNGNALDTAGANNGTATNVTYTVSDRGYQKQCGVFGATSSVTSSATFTNVQTLYFRIYPTANTKTLATLVTSTSIVSINSSSQIATTGLTTVNVYVNNVATTQLVLNTWNDVVITCDAKTFSNLNVGSSSFLGNIGRVAFFNRVLSSDEIQKWYLEGLRKLGGGSMSGLFDGLVEYYDFRGDANGTVGGNNGTVTGATLTTNRFGFANGAYSFDGNDYITVSNSALSTTINGRTGLSMAFVVNYTNFTGTPIIIDGRDTDYSGCWIECSTGGVLKFIRSDGSTADTTCQSSALSTGTTYIVVLTYDGTTANFYVNGTVQTPGTSTRTVNAATITNFGSGYAGATRFAYLTGKLEGFIIFSITKTAAEAKAISDLMAINYLLPYQ